MASTNGRLSDAARDDRAPGRADRWRAWHGDASLSALLAVQALTLFVAIPLGAGHPAAHVLFDACHLAFAALSAVALTSRRLVRGALLAMLVLIGMGPAIADRLGARPGPGAGFSHMAIPLAAFAFNALVTTLVVRRVFGPGRVTGYRVQGAVLVYLNVAALFAITYGLLEAYAPGAIAPSTGGTLAGGPEIHTAALSYFSLTTITTTGYGDLAPVHPLARSLANVEAVFGQLFPATLLARLVSLHVAHAAAPADAAGGGRDARRS